MVHSDQKRSGGIADIPNEDISKHNLNLIHKDDTMKFLAAFTFASSICLIGCNNNSDQGLDDERLSEVESKIDEMKVTIDQLHLEVEAANRTLSTITVMQGASDVVPRSTLSDTPGAPRGIEDNDLESASTSEADILLMNLRTLRNQIALYQNQHYDQTPNLIEGWSQLLRKTDVHGRARNAGDGRILYGPYLRSAPINPINQSSRVCSIHELDHKAGWAMDAETGEIFALVHQEAADRFNLDLSDIIPYEFDLVELILISEKFEHGDPGEDGRVLYDVTITVLVSENHVPMLAEKIEDFQHRLREEYARLFSESDTAALNDPQRTVIKNATRDICDLHLGTSENGESYIDDVIISDWKRFRFNF